MRVRWRFRWWQLRKALYGLTHRNCVRCGKRKGLNTHRHCYSCQIDNLMRALYEE